MVGLSTVPSMAQDPPTTAVALPSVFPSGYIGHDALSAALRKAVETNPERLGMRSLGKSLEDRDLWLVTVGKPDRFKPAVLVAANLEGDHVIGSQVALKMVERFAKAEGPTAAWLDRITLYIVPRLNPDGAERALGRVANVPASGFRGNARPLDRDRDGSFGEDPPDDLDGDGLITMLRHKNPVKSPLTLIPDPDDPRVLRKADTAKGERGVLAEEPEGKDDDRDGLRDEDPVSGVDLARNWPRKWKEYDPEAGSSPASEPEVLALIQFVFEHPEITAVWSFGLLDSLKEEPKKPDSTLDEVDLPLFAELYRVHQKTVGAATSASNAKSIPPGTTDGALSEWAYHQFGVVSLSSRLWTSPEVPPPARPAPPAVESKQKGQHEEKGKGEPDRTASPAKSDNTDSEAEARWLAWNDQVMGGRAFVPFKSFEHPDLGPVEIGGWKPGVRLNPPIEDLGKITETALSFLADLSGKMPRLSVGPARVDAKGGGLFEVTAVVENAGYFPTALAQGVKTKCAPPVLVRLNPDGAKLLAGRRLERIESLAGSGGRQEFRWLLQASDEKARPTLEVSCPKAGQFRLDVPLR